MDSLFVLAGLLGVGDLVLTRAWWRERARRTKAERHADEALRDKYKLLDALERKAVKASPRPERTIEYAGSNIKDIREALRQARERDHRTAESGGIA